MRGYKYLHCKLNQEETKPKWRKGYYKSVYELLQNVIVDTKSCLSSGGWDCPRFKKTWLREVQKVFHHKQFKGTKEKLLPRSIHYYNK